MTEERLQKWMARAGIGSRRACEEMIRARRISVNGHIASLGDRADPAVDQILLDGEPLRLPEAPVVVALHKPPGVLCTDPPPPGARRPAARSLIGLEGRLFAVGRLDADSEGLVLYTNDGELAQRLAHPRYGHDKAYRVLVSGQPGEETLRRWQSGICLQDPPEEEVMTRPAQVLVLEPSPNGTWLQVTMREGRKRQIRRVALHLGYPVIRLIRERIGPISLGALQPGEWRLLTEQELSALQRLKRDQMA
jgi:pseudouridine synthase